MIFTDSTLLDRTVWFIAGALIGFVIGWFVQHIRETQSDLKKLTVQLEQLSPGLAPPICRVKTEKGERGAFSARSAALVAVVLLTAYAAFSAQLTNNRVTETQNQLSDLTMCNQSYLGRTIQALNERTTFSVQQSKANVTLQRAQASFLSIVLVRPLVPADQIQDALQVYFDALTDYTDINAKTLQKVSTNPYPTEDELRMCLANARMDN